MFFEQIFVKFKKKLLVKSKLEGKGEINIAISFGEGGEFVDPFAVLQLNGLRLEALEFIWRSFELIRCVLKDIGRIRPNFTSNETFRLLLCLFNLSEPDRLKWLLLLLIIELKVDNNLFEVLGG